MEGSFMISHRALRRVSLAVTLIDDLTGEAIQGSNSRAWIENGRAPVKKSNGCFVFTDLDKASYTVLAEGGFYQRQSAEVTIDGDEIKTLTLRLRPARNYPAPPGCIRIEGRAEPFSQVSACICDRQAALKLLSDAESGAETLRIYHPDNISIEGGGFRIQGADGSSESLVIEAPVPGSDHTYSLLSPLCGSYTRIGTLLLPVSQVSADKKGEFFILLRASPSVSRIVLTAQGENLVTKEYDCTGADKLSPVLEQMNF